jgi:hypothetical protein
MTFEEECMALLKSHGMEYDPRYVFGMCRTSGALSFFHAYPALLRAGANFSARLRRWGEVLSEVLVQAEGVQSYHAMLLK